MRSKGVPDEIAKLIHEVSAKVSNLEVRTSPGGDQAGNWWVYFSTPQVEQVLVLEWHPGKGVGIYSEEDDGYGEGPGELFRDLDIAARRVVQRLDTSLSFAGLKELRELLGVSQVALAERLQKGQAAISRFESRDQILLDTLEDYVTGLGGQLKITAHFDRAEIPIRIRGERREGLK